MTTARDISDDMQALLDAAVDAVILIDHQGTMRVANRSAERMFGYAAAELLGHNVSMLMPANERDEHDGYIARFIRTGEARVIGRGRKVLALRRDGSTFPAQLSVGQVAGAEPPRFAGFVHDLTDENAMDIEVRRAQERLAQVARFASMGEMAAGLSHELNQPLAAIATYAQACDRLLANPTAELPAVQDALRQIAAQALRAGEIIRRLRQLVRERKSEHRREDLNEVVAEVAALAAHDLRTQRVVLEFDLAGALPRVDVDRVQIQQVLLNLVRNAIEALGELPAARRHITLGTAALDNRRIEICVRDEGPGVTPEAMARMFDPFFTTKPEGTGLGLAISRTIARAHHGTLGHRAGSDGGSEFFLRLPVPELP
jgi:two-component system, LuxR family, sensor kinase FixL